LAANICAAKYLAKNKQPGLYRVHQGPTEEKLTDLRRFLDELGLKMPGHREPVPADYAHILRGIGERPDAHMIQTVLLRSMSQAVYSPDNKGHFGLAYEAYTHFTSPIRRYPDILVHRILNEVLNQKIIIDKKMDEKCKHCSERERAAMDAERAANKYKQVEYLKDYQAKEFDGVIRVSSFGFWVKQLNINVGFSIHSLFDYDDFRHESDYCLVGRRSGRTFRMGDKVRIKVISANLAKRQLIIIGYTSGVDEP
jgi:ribonuclease R